MEPVSRSDISFHSQWKRRTQPVSSFHLEWKPIPELLPAFHPQWNPISERNIDFHSRWISHSVLSGRSIHDGSRVLLPHQAYRLKEETYGFSLRPTSLLESPSLGLHPPTPSRGEPTPTRPGEGGSDGTSGLGFAFASAWLRLCFGLASPLLRLGFAFASAWLRLCLDWR